MSNKREKYLINQRIFLIFFFFIVLYLTLVIYLFYLQIINYSKYKILSNNNSRKTRKIYGPRGIIYDRNKEILVTNKLAFRLILLLKNKKNINDIFNTINNVFDISLLDLKKEFNKNYFTIIKIFHSVYELNNWQYNNKLNENTFFEEYWYRDNLYSAFNHVTGYMQYDINKEYPKKGLEKICNDDLEGPIMLHEIYIDTHKNVINHIKKDQTIKKGKDLITTLSLKAQLYSAELLKNYNGSIIVMNKKGEVIVNYSSPELLVYKQNKNNKNKIGYLNKILQCQYPPGSVFKIISSLTLLTLKICEGVICNGFIKIGNRKFHCWNRNGHGSIRNVKEALQKSCNIFFYVNCQNNTDYLEQFFIYLKELGFSNKTQDLFPEEIKAVIKKPTKKIDMMMISIGQGFANSTLIQNCKMIGSIMSGYKIKPKFILNTKETNKNKEKLEKLNIDENILKSLKEYILSTFDEGGGCYDLRVKDRVFFGKTGTAQVMSMKDGKSFQNYKKEHALFTGGEELSGLFISVIVENAGFGVKTAGVFAVKMIKYIIDNDLNNNLF
jgi:penicillin-binding protein 2